MHTKIMVSMLCALFSTLTWAQVSLQGPLKGRSLEEALNKEIVQRGGDLDGWTAWAPIHQTSILESVYPGKGRRRLSRFQERINRLCYKSKARLLHERLLWENDYGAAEVLVYYQCYSDRDIYTTDRIKREQKSLFNRLLIQYRTPFYVTDLDFRSTQQMVELARAWDRMNRSLRFVLSKVRFYVVLDRDGGLFLQDSDIKEGTTRRNKRGVIISQELELEYDKHDNDYVSAEQLLDYFYAYQYRL